jgi:hypothetical protein
MAKPLTKSQWQKRKGGFKSYTRYVRWWNSQNQARQARFGAGLATPQEISRLAAQGAAEAIRPERMALEAQAERAETRARARQQDIGQFSLAAAEMLKGVAPQVNQFYGEAADRQSAYSRGMAAGQQMAEQGAAGQANQLLAQHGAPTQQTPTGAQGEVLFGLGTLPAGTLAAQGAAFGSAAAFLPGSAVGRGQQDIRAAARTADEEQAAFDAQLATLQAKRPGLIGDITRQLQADQVQRQSIQTQNAYLQASLRRTGAEITGVDPVTGQPTYEAQSDAARLTAQAAAAEARAAEKAAGKAATAAQKRQAARAKAVKTRNDKTVTAIMGATDWIESQVKGGTERRVVPGEGVPIKSHTQRIGKQTIQYYVKKGGGVTTNVAEASKKPVYETVPISKPQYQQLRSKLIRRLTPQLRRFGYRPNQITGMAEEILNDYYSYEEKYGKRVVGESAAEKAKR